MSGNSTLCPDERIGLYQCTTIGTDALRWIINGQQIIFDDVASDREVLGITITAYLVEEIFESGSQIRGNRTSILRYVADFDNTDVFTIACDSGERPSCSMEVLVVGELSFPPS